MSWKEYPQNLRVRLVTSFFNSAVSSAVMPFMALFFAQELGKVWAGLFLVFIVFVSLFIKLIGGYISDRFKRKNVLVITSSLNAFLFLIMTISLIPDETMIVLFGISYVLYVITNSFGRPAMRAIIIDSSTPDNRKAIYAIEYWLGNLAMAIGIALGGLLYISHQKELFMLLTITSLSLPIAYQVWLKDQHINYLKKQVPNVFIDIIHNYRVAFQDKAFVKVVVGSMFIFSAEFSLNSYIGVRLAETFKSVNLGRFEVGGVHLLSILNIENMLLVVCMTFFITKFTNRFRKEKVILIGLILYGIGYVMITSANVWYVLIFFNLIATIGELIYSPVRNAEIANMIPANKRGSYSALSGLSYNGSNLIARSTIIIGSFLMPMMMSVYIGVIVLIGIFLLYTGLFVRDSVKTKIVVKDVPV